MSEKTVRNYLDTLCSTFMARRLEPWFENLAKRQVKAPKIYLADSGILHLLLGIKTMEDLLGHPKIGASWEGFAVREIIAYLGAEDDDCFFWRLHSGAELDLFVRHGRRRLGFEIKFTSAPRVTPSMRSALENLKLEEVVVVHAGADCFPMTEGIRAVALDRLKDGVEPLRSAFE